MATGEELDPEVFERLAARLSYVQGDFADASTYARVRQAIEGASAPVFYLEIPPFLFATVVKGLTEAGLTDSARVVVEKPFGHDRASARALAEELHQYVDESQIYRIDHYLGKMGLEEILYLRFAQPDVGAGLEQQPRRVRADHAGGGLRGRGSRALLRPRRRAARRGRQPPDAGRRGGRDGAARRRRRQDAQGRDGRGVPRDPASRSGPLRARPVRRLPRYRRCRFGFDAPRRTRRFGSRSTTGAGPAFRSSFARASGCRSRRPSCALSSSTRPSSGSRGCSDGRSPTSW